MIKFLKLALPLFAVGIFLSCGLSPLFPEDCGKEAIYGKKIHFEKYYSDNKYEISFREDSSFSYLEFLHQQNAEGVAIQDTITMLNGKFKISEDSGFPWYVLELDADYIYEKEITDSLDGILHFTNFIENDFKGFEDKFFTNTSSAGGINYRDGISGANGCFSLYAKSSYSDLQHGECVSDLKKSKTFCLEQLKAGGTL
jgi:hypothetical protein